MKRSLTIMGLLLLIVLTVSLFRFPYQSTQLTGVEGVKEKVFSESGDSVPRVAAAQASIPHPPGPLPRVTMSAAKYKVDPFALSRESENPPFEFRGQGTSGKVIDRQGNVLLQSSEEIGIFGAAVSPDKQKVLIKGANATNYVVDPSTTRKIKLPSIPPGTNMLGLAGWAWIGPDLLFASSGVQAFNKSGEPVRCCEGHNVAQTKFYVFDLITEQLSDVVMPSAVTQALVRAVDVMSDGHIHLMHELPHEDTEQDLGWFRIDALK